MKNWILILCVLLVPLPGFAQPFSVNWFKVAGGGGTSTNAEFTLSGTFGQHDAGGPLLGAGFSVVGGFWSSIAVQVASPLTGNPPVITNGPQELVTLTNVSLPVAITGSPPMYFQWQKNGINLTNSLGVSGATNSVLTLTLAVTNYPGSYRLFAVNPYGSVTSSIVVISPYSAPHIIQQPQSMTVRAGDLASFYANASGNPAPSYRWNNLTNAFGPSYSFTAWYPGSAQVMVSNLFGTEVSSVAMLTVTDMTPPSFTQQPQSTTNAIGSVISLTTAADGNPLPEYAWRLNGSNTVFSSGSSSVSAYTFQALNSAFYDVVASNRYGIATSSVAVIALTNGYAPAILAQPKSRTNMAGTVASFSVIANGSPTPSYLWRINGSPTFSGLPNYAGPDTFIILAGSGGSIDVVVANYYGSVTSSVAALTVTAPVNGATDLITFDDFVTGPPSNFNGAPVASGYHGFMWNNFYALNAVSNTFNPSGYQAGILSVSNVAYNLNGYPASLSKAAAFDLVSGHFTAAWNDNLQLEVVGRATGGVLYSNNYVLSATTPTLINFNYPGVTNITFTTSGGTAHPGYNQSAYPTFALDNLSVRTAGGLFFVTTKGNLGFTNQQFLLTLSGPAGSNAVISASTNLQNWTPLVTNPLVNGSLIFTDTLATNFTRRFYRATFQP